MVVQSWSNEATLEELTKAHRTREIIYGVIRGFKQMNVPVPAGNGKHVTRETTTLLVALPNGVTGYCAAHDFKDFKISSYNRFVGTKDAFVITQLNLDTKVAYLSGVEANRQLVETLWTELKEDEENGVLNEKEHEAVVTGLNLAKGVVHVNIQGQAAYMFRSEWSWNEREGIDADIGETIGVKIIAMDPTNRLLRVSRKRTMADPMEFLNQLKRDDVIAGKIVQVSAMHGIFVEVETGVVLKGTKPRSLEEPDVGDRVTCRVERVDAANRRGRVVITHYPQGKRKKKDLGSFLFED